MTNEPARTQSQDKLLWLAAAVIAGLGAAWLVLASPWSTPELDETLDLGGALAVREPAPVQPIVRETPETPADAPAGPLHMARMALEAGMLVEPAEYSAWTLYGRVADEEPANAEAREGLDLVAAALLERGRTAFEQTRYDDATAIAERVVSRLPEHDDALALLADIEIATRPPEPEPEPEPAPAPVAEPEPAPVDPIPALHAAFLEAMRENDVLRPAGSSAVDLVEQMLEADAEHELTGAARELLVTELLDRSAQAIEALDTQAARTWIDSAAPLAADEQRILAAEARLVRHLIDQESEKLLPASALTALETPAPEFPRIPLLRELEGWVELEFVVTEDGTTEDITVTGASHRDFFRDEAIAAVSEWRFAPSIFMGEPISRRTYTRLEFVLD